MSSRGSSATTASSVATGSGIAKPFPVPVARHLRSGYLVRADTIEALARACGIDATGAGRDRPSVQRARAPRRRSTLRSWFDALQPQAGRSRRSGRIRASRRSSTHRSMPSRCEPGSFGTFAGLRDQRTAQVLGSRRPADRRPLCRRRRHGQRDGRLLSVRRHQPRTGDDLRIPGRPACPWSGAPRHLSLSISPPARKDEAPPLGAPKLLHRH